MQQGSPGVVVRTASDQDLAEIARLRSLWTGVAVDRAFERRMDAWITGDGDRRTTWPAWVGGDAVGMASVLEYRRMPRPGHLDSRWGYLSNMLVRRAPTLRRLG